MIDHGAKTVRSSLSISTLEEVVGATVNQDDVWQVAIGIPAKPTDCIDSSARISLVGIVDHVSRGLSTDEVYMVTISDEEIAQVLSIAIASC